MEFGQILDNYCFSKRHLDMTQAMLRCTFDMTTEVCFAVNTHAQGTESSIGRLFLDQYFARLREQRARFLNPLRKFMFWNIHTNKVFCNAKKTIISVYRKITQIYDNASAFDSSEKERSIMARLNDPKGHQRIANMDALIAEGLETTSHTLTFLIIALIQNPRSMQRLQEELAAAIPLSARVDRSQYPPINELLELPYLSWCVKETMRLWPVKSAGSKRVTLAEFNYRGMRIPKGSVLLIPYYSMFRQPWIDRPNDFIPERWDEVTNPQFSELQIILIPFGHGPRNCTGKYFARIELVAVASFLIRFYDFKLVTEPEIEVLWNMKPINVFVNVLRRH